MSEVLVVDDSAMLRLLVSYTLSGADGFEVRESAGAADALEAIGGGDISMVLTDFHMPGMDGVELVRAIRAMPEHHDLPVIMMTSDDDPVVRRAALEAGVDEFIVKPFEPSELHAAVRRMLEDSIDAEEELLAHRIGAVALLEAFPYPAMVLDADHTVVMGNSAFYAMTGTGISDRPPRCCDVMHGDDGRPERCPLVEAVRTGSVAERSIHDRFRGPLQVSVYPMEREHLGRRRLFLHLARPTED